MDAKTAAAVMEMMKLAAKQFANYNGPITVTLLRDRETDWHALADRELSENLPAEVSNV